MASPLTSRLHPGDVVAVNLPPGRAWLDILRATADADAAVVPVDWRLAAPEVRALLHDARPTMVVDASGAKRRWGGVDAPPGTALIIATSGTAGEPRFVELGRDAVAAAVAASARAIDGTPADPWLCCIPVAHIGGHLVLWRHLLLGAPIRFRRRLTARSLTAMPAGSCASLVPTQLRRCLEGGASLGHLRAILVGGAAVDADLAAAARRAGAPVIPTYGLTESCGGVVYAGRPLAGMEVRTAADGELLLRGPTLMRGYRLDPDATTAAFAPGGWLRTGDAGAVEADGTVRVHGRRADVIVSGGEKIWPAEVEAALAGHPSIAEVAVRGAPDHEWGERVVAQVVPRRRSAPPDLESIRDFAAQRIARFKTPRELVVVDRIDRTGSGKVRRRTGPAPPPQRPA